MAENPHTFHVIVASVGETLFDGAAMSVTVPGIAGEMTLLPNHEPIVSPLRAGTVTVRETLGEKSFSIESGVLECSGDRAVVLL